MSEEINHVWVVELLYGPGDYYDGPCQVFFTEAAARSYASAVETGEKNTGAIVDQKQIYPEGVYGLKYDFVRVPKIIPSNTNTEGGQ